MKRFKKKKWDYECTLFIQHFSTRVGEMSVEKGGKRIQTHKNQKKYLRNKFDSRLCHLRSNSIFGIITIQGNLQSSHKKYFTFYATIAIGNEHIKGFQIRKKEKHPEKKTQKESEMVGSSLGLLT